MRLDSAAAPTPAPAPVALAAPAAAPPVETRLVAVAAAPPGRLRRSLNASLAEGMLAEIAGACVGSTVLTAWALRLAASPLELSLLAALPSLMQLVRLPGAWLVERLSARRLAVPSIVASRLVALLLVALPLVALPPARERALLLAVAALASLLSIVGNCGWTVWMSELVPARVRGRYFGRRTAAATSAAMLTLLLASVAVDGAHRSGHEPAVLSLLALVAALAGVGSWALLVRQHDPAPPRTVDSTPVPMHAPLVDTAARPLLAFQLVWNGALGLASAFFALYMLGPLQLGLSWVALHGLVVSAMRVVTAPAWGRALDRHGARAVVIVCSAAMALAPLLWLFVGRDNVWLLCLDPIWVGLFGAGHALALFDLPLRFAPRRGRAYYLAAFAMAGGVAFAAAAAVGGALGARGGGGAPAMHALFVGSAAARALAAVCALKLVPPAAERAI